MGKLKLKYGTMANYSAINTKDPDTLYFITDRGLIYKGGILVTSKIGIESSGENENKVVTITDFSTNPNSEPATFTVYSSSAINAIKTTIEAWQSNHAERKGKTPTGTSGEQGYDDGRGHVALSDLTNSQLNAADGGTAATPKAVADAVAEAKQYADDLVGGLSGAMQFKGVIGTPDQFSAKKNYAVGDYCTYQSKLYVCTEEHAAGAWNSQHFAIVTGGVIKLPYNYKAGWTYRVLVAGLYADNPCEVGDMIIAVNNAPEPFSATTSYEVGDMCSGTAGIYRCTTPHTGTWDSSHFDKIDPIHDDWTVAQNNIDGAVTAGEELDANALVLGNGNRTVKKLAAGTNGQFLSQGANGPQWTTLDSASLGIAYGECSTAAATAAKTVTYTGFTLKEGAIVVVRFVNNNTKASATLNFGSTGAKAIYYNNSSIDNKTIVAGDVVTLIYHETMENETTVGRWYILSIERPMETTPTENSQKAITSGAVYTALQGKQDTIAAGTGIAIGQDGKTISIDADASPTENSAKPVTSGGIYAAIEASKLKWEEIQAPQQ